MNKFRFLIGVMMSLFIFSACAGSVDDGRVKVVTTVGMLADVVENIGGDFVNVEALMGPGVDPHLYQASAGDIGKLENADVIFLVGLHLEGKMVEIFESLEKRMNVDDVGEVVDKSVLLAADPTLGGTYDPHIWFDVDLWSQVVPEIVANLSEVDPVNAEFYQANGNKYLAVLRDLDKWTEEQIYSIPKERRLLITAHDAFGYFGQAYGMEVRGIQGISTSSDYGLKDLEELIDLIVERKIKAIFVESSVSRKSIEALQEGVNARDWSVEIGGELFSDAMGKAGTVEGTYVGMVEHNVNIIVNALK